MLSAAPEQFGVVWKCIHRHIEVMMVWSGPNECGTRSTMNPYHQQGVWSLVMGPIAIISVFFEVFFFVAVNDNKL